MSVTIRIRDNVASIENGKWSSKDKATELLVSLWTPDDIENYSAWPDYTLAEIVSKAVGGEIIKTTDKPKYIDGRVY